MINTWLAVYCVTEKEILPFKMYLSNNIICKQRIFDRTNKDNIPSFIKNKK